MGGVCQQLYFQMVKRFPSTDSAGKLLFMRFCLFRAQLYLIPVNSSQRLGFALSLAEVGLSRLGEIRRTPAYRRPQNLPKCLPVSSRNRVTQEFDQLRPKTRWLMDGPLIKRPFRAIFTRV